MRVRPWLLTWALSSAALAGTATAHPPKRDAEVVKAYRYRVFTAESAMEFTHGGGRWIEELWFPDRKFVANVETTWNDGKEEPVVRAFFSERMRNWSQTSGLETVREQPAEEVTVPRDLADRLFALADAARRAESERVALGPLVVAAKVLRAIPDDREGWPSRSATPESPTAAEASAEARAWLDGWAEPVGMALDPVSRFPSRVRRKRDGAEMVLIPRGPFEFGGEARIDEAKGEYLKGPSRSAELTKSYYMDVDEVTVAQWRGFAEATKAAIPDLGGEAEATEPIRDVTHVEATEYARWVRCALPSEAQWERAARANDRFANFPNDRYHDPAGKRNGAGSADGFAGVAPVGSFPPNGWGLRDLSGNVAEWCADGFGPFPGDGGVRIVGEDALVDPVGPADSPQRVVKGGSYLVSGNELSIGHREAMTPDARRADVGFRTVRVLP
jgi:formylglycine-generating enzyme required for sulfatase activity